MHMLEYEQPLQEVQSARAQPKQGADKPSARTVKADSPRRQKKEEEIETKKCLTLLGPLVGPEGGEEDALASTTETAVVKETPKDEEGGEVEQPMPIVTKNVKPRFLMPKKKGPFDKFFEMLNVDINENRQIVRHVYMVLGGLLEENGDSPQRSTITSNFMMEEETQNKLSEAEAGENFLQEEAALAKKGLE